MGRVILLAILFLSLLATAASPQQTPDTGIIQGTIVRADTGGPIAGAQVTLVRVLPLSSDPSQAAVMAILNERRPIALGTPPAVTPAVSGPRGGRGGGPTTAPGTFSPLTTGDDGKFSFPNLPVGTYQVTVTANTFMRQEYGQRTVYGAGRPIYLMAGQSRTDITIRLTPLGSVSGRILSEDGQPATGAPVRLIRSYFDFQGQTYQTVGSSTADDRGDYRMSDIPPGRYYLVAGHFPGPVRSQPVGGNALRYEMVLYPRASTVDQAVPVEVMAGAEQFFDLTARRQLRTYSVRGRVVHSTGGALPDITVGLTYRTFDSGGSLSQANSFDSVTSTFALRNIAPGEYVVYARVANRPDPSQTGIVTGAAAIAQMADQASRPLGEVSIRVVDSDVEDVVVLIGPGVSVRGRVVAESQQLSSVQNLDLVRPAFMTKAFGQESPIVPPTDSEGNFEVRGLRQAEYRVIAPAPVSGFYVKTIRYAGEDILSKPFMFSGKGSGNFEVVLRSGAARLTGTVTDPRSQPVPGIQIVLVPSERHRIENYRPTFTGPDGRFSLNALVPGDYKIFSWEAADVDAYYDPAFLMQHEHLGQSLRITESSNQNVDVKLIQ